MISHLVLLPVLLPLVGAALSVLVLRAWPRAQAWWSLVVMLASMNCSATLLHQVWSSGAPVIAHVGGWAGPFGISIVGDILGATMALMCQVVLVTGVLYAMGSRDACVRYPSFHPLLLTLATGLTGAMLTGDLFNLFVFIELLVISATVLTASSDNKAGVEAAYKYFYISQFAAVMLLLANGCLYAAHGTLNLADLSQRIAEQPDQPLSRIAMVLLMGAFAIKCAAVPFHFWQPDFHTTSPTAVSAMLSSIVVKVGVYGFLRMMTLLYPSNSESIGGLLLLLGGAGVIFGGLSAVGTHDVKRMLAYSTLAQLGFILMAMGWNTSLGLAAAIVFAVNHALVKSAMLMLAGAVASRSPVKSSSFAAVTGLGSAAPGAGLLFLLGGLALAGIPPTNGFISKWGVFVEGVNRTEWWSVGVLGLGSLFTLLYVARAFMRLWWEPLNQEITPKPYGDALLAPAVLVTLCVLLGLWAQPLLELGQANADWLASPASYIRAVLEGER